ncbi:MAG: NAD(P)-dependent oxidoreductase [Armatimonadetes bacterium]|nr:NAD(P)-dependent oxidoreductase [Armatimonadota bacterium]
MSKKRVLITGASGLIGGLVRTRLADRYEFSALNRRPVEGMPCLQADIADFEAIRPAFQGQDAVVHLSAYTGTAEDPAAGDWEQNLHHSIIGCRNVYEAAAQAGVKRFVFGSSGCTILGHEREYPYHHLVAGEYDQAPAQWDPVTREWPVRPDGIYGCCKAFGEVLGRYYADEFGMSVLCIRLGAVLDTDRPKLRRQYPGYLSHRDVVEMVRCCLDAPDDLVYEIVDAVSNNRWRWRDIEHARKVIGYVPQDSADQYELEETA